MDLNLILFLGLVGAIGGLIFLMLGLLSLGRRKGREQSMRPTMVRLTFAVIMLGATGLLGWKYKASILRLFVRDHTADPSALEELQRARLDGEDKGWKDVWPQWRGPRRDGKSDETGLLAGWPENGAPVRWRKPINGGFSSVAIANGRIYTLDSTDLEERVLCLDAETGKDLWIHRYTNVERAGEGYPGPRATPTVHDGRLYTVGAAGVFVCLEAEPEDGQPKVLWQHDLHRELNGDLPRWGFACSPLIEGDMVIVQPGGSAGAVAAFHRVTGRLAWRALDDASGYSSPIAVTAAGVRQIICFTGEGLAGLRPEDGGKLWYFPWPTEYQANIATPIVAGDYVFISSAYQAGCALLRIVPEGGGLQAVPIFIRPNKVMRNHHSSCVLHEGFLYGFDTAGSQQGFLKCIDFRTLEEKWTAGRDLVKGSLIYADGHFIVLTENGSLALVEATPEGYRKKSQFQLFEGSQIWAPPALAGGRLYLRDHRELVCLDLRK